MLTVANFVDECQQHADIFNVTVEFEGQATGGIEVTIEGIFEKDGHLHEYVRTYEVPR
jgi:hypothetical protein